MDLNVTTTTMVPNATLNVTDDHHGFNVIDVHFEGLGVVIFFLSLFVLFDTLGRIIFHLNKALHVVPESCFTILIGVMLGIVIRVTNADQYESLSSLLEFRDDIFFLLFLPPIIFEAGYFLEPGFFFKNFGTILLFAIIGTLFNTFSLGLIILGLSRLGWLGTTFLPTEAFIFSSLISAVDPVAVLAIFESTHVNETLHMLVFGESVLNDAVSIVLYRLFVELQNPDVTVDAGVFFLSILKFFLVFFGGVLIGCVGALVCTYLMRFTKRIPVIQPLLVIFFAMLCYVVAEIVSFSGILAVLFCGLTVRHYTTHNMTRISVATTDALSKLLATTVESIVFMYLGISMVNRVHNLDIALVLMTIVAALVLRAIAIFTLSYISNLTRLHKIQYADQFIVFYGGLRGAIAFALAFILDGEQVLTKDVIVTTTLIVIFFTVFLMGSTIKPLLKYFRVQSASELHADRISVAVFDAAIPHAFHFVHDIVRDENAFGWRSAWRSFDNRLMSLFCPDYHHASETERLKRSVRDIYIKRGQAAIRDIFDGTAETVHAIERAAGAGAQHASGSQEELMKIYQLKRRDRKPHHRRGRLAIPMGRGLEQDVERHHHQKRVIEYFNGLADKQWTSSEVRSMMHESSSEPVDGAGKARGKDKTRDKSKKKKKKKQKKEKDN